MSNLKIGDIVMVGGAAPSILKQKNAGLFRTVTGFIQKGDKAVIDGISCYTTALCAKLDGNVWVYWLPTGTEDAGSWSQNNSMLVSYLVKINPGESEDETLTWAGNPSKVTDYHKETITA